MAPDRERGASELRDSSQERMGFQLYRGLKFAIEGVPSFARGTDAERASDGKPSFAHDSGKGVDIISELIFKSVVR
jgi:hypothetical protein